MIATIMIATIQFFHIHNMSSDISWLNVSDKKKKNTIKVKYLPSILEVVKPKGLGKALHLGKS